MFIFYSKKLDKSNGLIYYILDAAVVEQADTRDLKSLGSDTVPVQVRSAAPKHSNPNLLPIGETFGFVVFLKDVK